MDKLNRLKEVEIRLKELKPVISKSFDTKEELDFYFNENSSFFEEYEELIEELDFLKNELLSPEEKAEKEEYDKMYKLKREGKLFDYLSNKKRK